jgi:VanZ family protein
MKKLIKWSLLIGWMIVIFLFSQQSGEVSSEQSRFVVFIFNTLSINLDSALGELSTYLVRKAAHFTEYFILGTLAYNVVKDEFKYKPALLLTILIVFLYACTDEFHQSFIPGRGPAFKDVLIDTSGGVAAMACIYLWGKHKKIPSRKKRELIK